MAGDVTEAELMEALRAALEPADPQDAVTVDELMRATSRNVVAVRRGIRELIDQGAAEPIIVRRKNIAGRWGPVPGYRLRKAG